MTRRLAIVSSVAALALSACTVKEERTDCPCWLEVSFNDREHITGDVTMIGFNNTLLFKDVIDVDDYPDTYSRAVEKGYMFFCALEGNRNNEYADHYVTVPMGTQVDSIYTFSAEMDCTGELAPVTVSFRKQFATVYINFGKTADGMRPYSFIVRGEWCGIDLVSGRSIPGSYRWEPKVQKGSNIVSFRVPRQGDSSLRLGVTFTEGTDTDVSTVAIGEYIRKIGYNWDAEVLQDIFISIDLINGRINVGVADWESGVWFDEGGHIEI